LPEQLIESFVVELKLVDHALSRSKLLALAGM
jgi:hypothetical protein